LPRPVLEATDLISPRFYYHNTFSAVPIRAATRPGESVCSFGESVGEACRRINGAASHFQAAMIEVELAKRAAHATPSLSRLKTPLLPMGRPSLRRPN
jgi:hypothetical protein